MPSQLSPSIGSPSYSSTPYSVKASSQKPHSLHMAPLRLDVSRPKIGGGTSVLSPISRELPMPNVTRIYNLAQAHATLLHCWNKLSRMSRSAPGRPRSPEPDSDQFHRWLDRWEQAFTDYLSSAMPSMTTEDLTQCRVLKANHLACTILASSVGGAKADYDAFEAEFHAIVELSGAVLRSRHETDSPRSTTSSTKDYHSSSSSGGGGETLDVRAALHVVATRSPHRKARNRAADLLTQYYQ